MPISSGVPSTKALPTVKNFANVLRGGISNAVGDTTEANDTVVSTATNLDHGAASITEAADTLSSAGTNVHFAAASLTEAADTVSAAGVVIDHGTDTALEANDTIASTGVVVVHGTAVPVDIDAVLSAGSVSNHGAASIQEVGDTLSAIQLPPQSTTITHFYNIPYITEEKLAGYVSSDSVIGVRETYYRKSS